MTSIGASTLDSSESYRTALQQLDDVPYNMSVFMNCSIGPDGSWSIQAPRSKPGDYVDFRAEMAVLAAFSNCPQINNACNAFQLKPLKAVIYQYKHQ